MIVLPIIRSHLEVFLYSLLLTSEKAQGSHLVNANKKTQCHSLQSTAFYIRHRLTLGQLHSQLLMTLPWPLHKNKQSSWAKEIKEKKNYQSKLFTIRDRKWSRGSLVLTVLLVATLKVPGIETPPPPPIVMPFKSATYMEIINTPPQYKDQSCYIQEKTLESYLHD